MQQITQSMKRSLFILALIGSCFAQAPSLVQDNGGVSSTAAASVAVAFASNVTAGNMMLACASAWSGVHGFTSITDTLGSTWTQAISYQVNGVGDSIQVWYATVPGGGGADTVTANIGGTDWLQFSIREVANITTLDQTGSNTTSPSSANTVTVTTGATSHASEYVLGCFSKIQNGTWGLGTGYSNLLSTNSGGGAHTQGSEDKVTSSTGTQSADMTSTGTTAIVNGVLVTFYGPGGGSPTGFNKRRKLCKLDEGLC